MNLNVQYVSGDDEFYARSDFGFIPVEMYASGAQVLSGEIGTVSGVKFVADPCDPVIEARRREIQTRLHAKIITDGERAECAIMGHDRGSKVACRYCGTKL